MGVNRRRRDGPGSGVRSHAATPPAPWPRDTRLIRSPIVSGEPNPLSGTVRNGPQPDAQPEQLRDILLAPEKHPLFTLRGRPGTAKA